MTRIALIGAGSMVFSRNVLADILALDALKDARFALMDIDADRLAVAEAMARSINASRGANATIVATADRRAALDGADFVINTIGVGGFDATKTDFDVPERFGLRQTIADTLGIGGIFRSIRSIPVLLEICRDIEQLAPDALLMNYTNPMATHVLAVARATRVRHVGLCHGIRYTRGRMILLARLARMSQADLDAALADWDPHEGAPGRFARLYHDCVLDETVETLAAGINHMAAFLRFERDGEDLYPLLHEAAANPAIRRLEPVRLDIFERLGWFLTETSGHLAEYLPWYLHSDAEIERVGLRPRCYLRTCEELARTFEDYRRKAAAGEPFIAPDEPLSIEYASRIIHAVRTNEPFEFNGNVHNAGGPTPAEAGAMVREGGALIANLPGDCCVEVPCTADASGVTPHPVGELPPQCAALMRTNVNVQDLVVRAILDRRRDHVHHAAMLDPNTAATLTLPEIHELVEAMFAAHGTLIPDCLRSQERP